jgi:hypothetical protein
MTLAAWMFAQTLGLIRGLLKLTKRKEADHDD